MNIIKDIREFVIGVSGKTCVLMVMFYALFLVLTGGADWMLMFTFATYGLGATSMFIIIFTWNTHDIKNWFYVMSLSFVASVILAMQYIIRIEHIYYWYNEYGYWLGR